MTDYDERRKRDELDERLASYLRWSQGPAGPAAEMRDLGRKLDAVAKELHEHALADERRHGELSATVTRVVERVDDLEQESEVTGVTTVQELRDKYREQKAALAEVHARRRDVLWKVALMVLSTGLGAAAARLLGAG